MSNNISEKSIESASIDNAYTSQNTQNKTQKIINIKSAKKDRENLSNNNSEEENELIRKKLNVNTNELELSLKDNLNSIPINNLEKKEETNISLSPIKRRRKRSVLVNMKEKSKRSKKSVIFTTEETKDKNEDKIERKDVYGVPINRRNRKKIKVTFSDTLNSNNSKNANNQLAEIIPIASYKKYNIIEGIPKEENHITNKATCKCCLIF